MKKYLVIILFGSLFVLVLTACGQSPSKSESVGVDAVGGDVELVSSDEGNRDNADDASQDQANTESDDGAPDPELIAMTEAEPDACIDCHTDQAALTNTAKPELDHESESEGEG